MSMPEFMNRLRLVSSMLPPGLFAFSGQVEGRLLQKALNSADIWLDPSFVSGVRADEFFYIDEFERRRLADNLARFAQVAEAAKGGQPLTADQRRQGLTLLVEFVKWLQPVPSSDKNMTEAMWALEDKYPDYVLGFDCRFGTDSTGDPAVWVWVVVPDETDVQTPAFDGFMDDLTRAARSWLERAGLPHWPYTRLLTPSDIKDEIAEVVE